MQQDSRPSRAKHDFHLASRSLARIKLQNRLPRRFFRKKFRSLFAEEEIQRDSSATARGTTRRVAFGLSDARYIHASQRLRILRKRSIRPDH